MATKEQYELGARKLANQIRESQSFGYKIRLMGYLGNLRLSQYRTTRELRARRLAGNCYIAARYLACRASKA